MNGYLQLKCRSEQQVMNEFTKCVAAKDFTSKRTIGLLHELTFFYVSINGDIDGTSGHIHDSILRDFSTLLMNIKDKKDDQKVAKMVIVLLQCIAEQMLHSQSAPQTSATSTTGPTSPRVNKTDAVMAGLSSLTDAVAKAEINHAYAPRRVAAYKLYYVLCATLRQMDRITPIISTIVSSNAWNILKLRKRGGEKELPSQLALLNGAMQLARLHDSLDILEPLLPRLIAGAFIPNRHAAAACLSLFEKCPLQVVAALMEHVICEPSISLNTSDALTTCYLLRLCGKISRLPILNRRPSNVEANLLNLSFDVTTKANKAVEHSASGRPAIEQHISTRIFDLLIDTCMQTHLFGLPATLSSPVGSSDNSTAAASLSTTTTTILAPCTMLLTAIEEMTLGQIAPNCFEKVRGGLSPFEIAVNGIQLVLQTHATNTIVLYRVCRTVQCVAECFDIIQKSGECTSASIGALEKCFSTITESMMELSLSTESNPYLLKETLIAIIWLLPRMRKPLSLKSQSQATAWRRFISQLMQLTAVAEVERHDILDALYRRGTRFDLDVTLLSRCTMILLYWYKTGPCHWHGDMMLQLWNTMISSEKCIQSVPKSANIFNSLFAVFDYHIVNGDAKAVQYMKCIALSFISTKASKLLVEPSMVSACVDIMLRLTKYVMVEDWPIRRLSIQALMDMLAACHKNNNTEMRNQLLQVLRALDKAPSDGYQDLLRPLFEQDPQMTPPVAI